MNSGTLIHSKEPQITIEFVHFGTFVATKIQVNDPDASGHTLEVLSREEPIIQLLPTRPVFK